MNLQGKFTQKLTYSLGYKPVHLWAILVIYLHPWLYLELGQKILIHHVYSHTNECHKTHNGWYSGMVAPIVSLLILYCKNVLGL